MKAGALALTLVGLLLGPTLFAKENPSTVSTAEYYYRQGDYRQAYPLWVNVLERSPENLNAFIRVAELMLWQEGRAKIPDRFRLRLESPGLNREERQLLKAKFWQIQIAFLTDAAQNLYFQGKHRLERGDFAGALENLQRASEADKGQFLILRDRAHVEFQLGQWGPYYETLKLAQRSYPYDPQVRYLLAEAHLLNRDTTSTLELLKSSDPVIDPKEKTLLAVALSDSGARTQALPVLRGLATSLREKVSPVIFYLLGDVLFANTATRSEGRRYLEKFVAAQSIPAPWDPFHLSERLSEAKRLLALP